MWSHGVHLRVRSRVLARLTRVRAGARSRGCVCVFVCVCACACWCLCVSDCLTSPRILHCPSLSLRLFLLRSDCIQPNGNHVQEDDEASQVFEPDLVIDFLGWASWIMSCTVYGSTMGGQSRSAHNQYCMSSHDLRGRVRHLILASGMWTRTCKAWNPSTVEWDSSTTP